jgi:protein-tyrosine phosphatase
MIYRIVSNQLYIGDNNSFQAVNFIQNEIHIIIDCKDLNERTLKNMDLFFERNNIIYVKSDTYDKEGFNIIDEFEQILKLIGDTNNKSILICCNCAISRSVAYSIMYLIKIKGYSLIYSILLIKNINENMAPNIGFIKQLILYEKLILDNNSITIKEYIKLYFKK